MCTLVAQAQLPSNSGRHNNSCGNNSTDAPRYLSLFLSELEGGLRNRFTHGRMILQASSRGGDESVFQFAKVVLIQCGEC